MNGEDFRFRVTPRPDGTVLLEVALVGPDVTENVHIALPPATARRLSDALRAACADVAGQERREAADLEARN